MANQKPMHQFTKDLKEKGYKSKDCAKRWNITPRAMSQIARAPKQIHLDALAGLPDKSNT